MTKVKRDQGKRKKAPVTPNQTKLLEPKGYLSVLGGYLDGWVDQVGGQDRWVGRSGG